MMASPNPQKPMAVASLVFLGLSALLAILAEGDRLPRSLRGPLLPAPAVLGEDIGQDDWLAIGPFVAGPAAGQATAAGGADLTEAIDRDWLAGAGGEEGASPMAIQRLDGPGWRFVHAEGRTVFLSEQPGTAEDAVVYAFREVETEGGGAAWLGSAPPHRSRFSSMERRSTRATTARPAMASRRPWPWNCAAGGTGFS